MRTWVIGILLALLSAGSAFAQSGKIAGRVTDAATGEGLPGVNVTIEGTFQGASTDLEGYYTILNVKPGNYELRASFVGFVQQLMEEVRVNIDQTTTINFRLAEAVFEGEEVVVTAERPVVERDVSASLANISAGDIEVLPVSTVTGVIGLQAGVQGLNVRGSSATELVFNLNGLSMRDERDNSPFTSVSLTSIDEIQIQTGGFNAEYGNVRSGVVNVVTKEGSARRYNLDMIVRYSPPAQKAFGQLANDPDAYWVRPFIDPAVAYTGTANGAWDEATRQQYPDFQGWIAVAEERLKNDDPTDDITPDALMQAWKWQHRKEFEITQPDYNLDVGFGGPVPFLSEKLGRARFYASLRRDREMYMIPLATDDWASSTGHLKITSDLARGMKLSVEGLLGKTVGTTSSRAGFPGMFRSSASIADQLNRVSFIDTRVFASDYWNPSETRAHMLGAKFTHSPNPNTFYEVQLTRFGTAYDTNPGRRRDNTPVVTIGGVGFDEGPFGFEPTPAFGVGGMRMGVGMSNARDTSRVVVYNGRFDITSQLNRFWQVKSGLEYTLTDSRVNYGTFDAFLQGSNTWSQWDRTPQRGAAYAQSKLEFQGMIANVGLRLDYAHAGGTWWEFGEDPFTKAFSARFSAGMDTLLTQEPTKRLLTLSPRLGVSFPITEFSKLFVNYGHFRSMPDPNNLYLLRTFSQTQQVQRVASPNNPLPKTISYELGYEQSLLNQFLIRLAGYYKNVFNEPFTINYISRDGQVDYLVSEAYAFADVRGFELTVSRNRGRWLQGFVNYTYMVYTSGYFGYRIINQNPTAQRAFVNSDAERRRASSRPVPRPYGRANLDLVTPLDWGPDLGGVRPLADWRLSVIGRWTEGYAMTWTGGGSIPGVLNNTKFRDSWGLDLRFARNFDIAGNRIQFFADVFNAWNRKQLSFAGTVDGNDYNAYMRSLHLPEDPNVPSQSWPNIPGKDRPGDYRSGDVPYQPMVRITSREAFSGGAGAPVVNTIYWENSSGQFIEFKSGSWQQVDSGRLDTLLKEKAYIDMPNQAFLTFLDPRDIYFGIRLSF